MATTPYNWVPEPHQLPVITNSARFKVIVWHRKAHKTTLAVNELVRWANAVPGTYWYISPTIGEAKKTIWDDLNMLPKYCPPEIWDKRNNTERFIPFPNGSKIYVLGADTPDTLRGPNPMGVILDEYDTMKPEMWSAVLQPIMMANPKSWCWFVGTYKGRKDLFQKYHYASLEMKEKGVNASWFCSILPASKSGIIAKENLEEARKTTTEAFYKQEYECEPLENASAVFRNIDQAMEVVDERSGQMIKYLGLQTPNPGRKYQIGIDLGKHQDFTVITPFDLTTFRALKQDRFNQIYWNLQKAKVELAYQKHGKEGNRPRMLMDKTGLGDPIFDDLSRSITTLEGFLFTMQSREDLLNNLSLKIEKGKIKIPYDEILLNELRSFQFVLKASSSGKHRIVMEVPDGVHDDTVISLALAVWDIPENPVRGYDEAKERREVLKEFDSRREQTSSLGSRYLRQKGF